MFYFSKHSYTLSFEMTLQILHFYCFCPHDHPPTITKLCTKPNSLLLKVIFTVPTDPRWILPDYLAEDPPRPRAPALCHYEVNIHVLALY